MHVTTQKTEFKGIDVTSVGRTKSFKVGPEKYVIPTEKVLGETVSMVGFQRIFLIISRASLRKVTIWGYSFFK
jgi:hypothetical protein